MRSASGLLINSVEAFLHIVYHFHGTLDVSLFPFVGIRIIELFMVRMNSKNRDAFEFDRFMIDRISLWIRSTVEANLMNLFRRQPRRGRQTQRFIVERISILKFQTPSSVVAREPVLPEKQ